MRETISGHATWNDFSFVPIGTLTLPILLLQADIQLDPFHSVEWVTVAGDHITALMDSRRSHTRKVGYIVDPPLEHS